MTSGNQEDADEVAAALELVGRTGATDLNVGYLHDGVTEKETLASYLRELHRKTGYRPSCRALGTATGISHTHINVMMKGSVRRIGWDKVEKVVSALQGDLEKARSLWTTHIADDLDLRGIHEELVSLAARVRHIMDQQRRGGQR